MAIKTRVKKLEKLLVPYGKQSPTENELLCIWNEELKKLHHIWVDLGYDMATFDDLYLTSNQHRKN